MTRLAFFPTPYPDEVLYSVLCRYHVRSGNPGANTSIKELWGRKGVAKSLYLPNGLDTIVSRLPEKTGITVYSLIWNHTMYPYVQPKLTKERADVLYSMLSGSEKEHTHTYPKAGLLYGRPSLPQYLRFCPACVKTDIEKYGEAYWHRLHQLPGVSICPVHDEYINDSPFFIHMIFRYFFPAAAELCKGITEEKPFSLRRRRLFQLAGLFLTEDHYKFSYGAAVVDDAVSYRVAAAVRELD